MAPNSNRAGISSASAVRRTAALLAGLADGEGFLPTRVPGVKFMRSSRHVPRTPVAYEPGIVIIAQGRKIGTFGARSYVYDEGRYLVLAMPMPFECETFGSPDVPLLGLSIGVTPVLIAELTMQMERPPVAADNPRAMGAATLDDDLAEAALRLARCLGSADDARILGPQIVREIVYLVLRGKSGASLRALAAPHSRFAQIGRVLARLHTDYARSADMPTLAREAGLSVSAFHTHFKAVTASSPLQYLKTVRLHKARLLMLNDGATAAQAADLVGYESPSQFSREFKRLFGAAPAAEAARLRTQLVTFA